MKVSIFAIAIVLILVRCTTTVSNNKGSDTSAIVDAVFSQSKPIDNHLVPLNKDTVYLIKNLYVNTRWPHKAGRFTMVFIEDTPASRQQNHLNDDTSDKRIRLGVPLFKVSADSAIIVLYNFNFGSEIKYYLKKQNSEWLITKSVKGME
jgi:hypothetical protein